MIIQRKLFARHDYEGLDDVQKEVLRKKRSEYAKALNKSRNELNLADTKNLLESNGWNVLRTEGSMSGGGVRSRFKVSSQANDLDTYGTLAKRHVKNIREQQLQSADSASKIMRDQVLNDLDGKVSKARDLEKYKSAKGSREVISKPKPEGVKPGNELVKVDRGGLKNSKGVASSEKSTAKSAKKLTKVLKKYKKPLLIGGGVAALGGAGIYGYKKLKKNKE